MNIFMYWVNENGGELHFDSIHLHLIIVYATVDSMPIHDHAFVQEELNVQHYANTQDCR